MDLSTLASNLRAQAAANDSTIVLDATVFPDAVLEGLRAAFALPSGENLTVEGVEAAAIPDPTEGGVLTISAGTASLLKQSNVAVGLTFTARGGDLQAIIVAEMSAEWKFKDSFDGLDQFPFDLLAVSGARFVYTTAEKADYAWPGEPSHQIHLAQGLNYLSLVTLKNFSALRDLLGPQLGDGLLKFYGPLAPKDGQQLPVGKLRAPLGDGAFKIPPDVLSLSTPALAVRIGEATEEVPLQQIDLLVESRFQKDLEVAVGIPVSGGALEISAAPLPHHSSVRSLIENLPGGQNFTAYIPAELSQIFDTVGLNNFSLFVAEQKVTYVGLSVGTLKPWTLIPDVLELKGLSLEIETIEPAGINWTRVRIEAAAKFLPHIFDGEFAFTVGLEKQDSWQVKTVSGSFYGGVNLGKIVKGLLGDNAEVPPVLSGIVFSDFGLSATRSEKKSPFSYRFHGSVEAAFPILDTALSSELHLAVTKTETGHTVHLNGSLVIGEQVFTLSLDLGKPDAKLTAKWQNSGTPLGFGDIARAFGWDSMPAPPEGLDLGLKDAAFTYDFDTKTVALSANSVNYGRVVFASWVAPPESPDAGRRVYLFTLDAPLSLKFSELPVVGKNLHLDTPLGVNELQIIAASASLAESDLTKLNTIVNGTSDKKHLIPTSLKPGLTLAAMLEMGEKQPVVVSLTGGDKRGDKRDDAEEVARAVATSDVPARDTEPPAPPAPAYGSDMKWLTLQRNLGPVYFDKVGVQYQEARLRFLLNAALSAAGLTLSLDGLSVSSPLTKFEPRFDLRGLGVDYKSEAFEIGGAFLRTPKEQSGKPYDEYDGAAVIKAKQLTISAKGSYAEPDGKPSLFIYAVLDYPIGGPSFFYVTGLAAGFGYNRGLLIPPVEEVAQFPLVADALSGAAMPGDLVQKLSGMQKHVPPVVGQSFFAVGIKFTSFKMVNSFALLTVSFGHRFELNVLGLSKLVAPTPVKDETVTPLAEVQMALKASYVPDEGFLGVRAQLTSDSYILSKDCHLTGGFAFYSWFAGPHAGDFVLTLGGYHPDYNPPDHYPKVPRVGFNWRVNDKLSIKGDGYYALTPSTLMAGGSLEATWESGDLKAWFKVGANFIIAWRPYHYDATVYVDIGVTYTFQFFGTRQISANVGADLHLWGPEFTGRAQIKLHVISWDITFDISFGAGAPTRPERIDWPTFKASFLPADGQVCSLVVRDGLLKDSGDGWVVNPKEFTLVTNSLIPATEAFAGKEALAVEGAPAPLGIAPMAVGSYNARHTIKLFRKGDTQDEPAEADFDFRAVTKKVPAAMWGRTFTPSLNGVPFVENALTGFEIRPRVKPKPGETATIGSNTLKYSPADVKDAFRWETFAEFAAASKTDHERRKEIKDHLAADNVVAERARLLSAFGIQTSVTVVSTSADALLAAPQTGTLAPSK